MLLKIIHIYGIVYRLQEYRRLISAIFNKSIVLFFIIRTSTCVAYITEINLGILDGDIQSDGVKRGYSIYKPAGRP